MELLLLIISPFILIGLVYISPIIKPLDINMLILIRNRIGYSTLDIKEKFTIVKDIFTEINRLEILKAALLKKAHNNNIKRHIKTVFNSYLNELNNLLISKGEETLINDIFDEAQGKSKWL